MKIFKVQVEPISKGKALKQQKPNFSYKEYLPCSPEGIIYILAGCWGEVETILDTNYILSIELIGEGFARND